MRLLQLLLIKSKVCYCLFTYPRVCYELYSAKPRCGLLRAIFALPLWLYCWTRNLGSGFDTSDHVVPFGDRFDHLVAFLALVQRAYREIGIRAWRTHLLRKLRSSFHRPEPWFLLRDSDPLAAGLPLEFTTPLMVI